MCVPQPSHSLFTCHLGGWRSTSSPSTSSRGPSFYTFGFICADAVRATGQALHYTPIDPAHGF